MLEHANGRQAATNDYDDDNDGGYFVLCFFAAFTLISIPMITGLDVG